MAQHHFWLFGYGICAGILSVFLVGAIAFFAAFGNPTILGKNVLAGVDIFFWVYGYI